MSFGDGSWNKDRREPAKIQRRAAILGGIALIAFGVILFRLWYLQVLSGDRYLAEAQGNRVREVTVQAPRGEILDRDGEVLVGNRTALALVVRKDELPENGAERMKVLERVAEVTGMSLEKVNKEIDKQTKLLPANPVTLQRDVPESVVFFVRENQAKFQGVSVDRVYVRQYPQGTTAAHLLGYVKEVSAEQLEEPAYADLEPGDEIGLDGVELSYDTVLRGVNGETRVPVDSSGSPTGRPTSVREPTQGNDLVLSIDSDLQAAGEGGFEGRSGAFVALDVETGEILAMGSSPTFDPSELAKPELSNTAFEQIFDPENTLGTGAPAFNRAIAAGYPTGSTFKPITALAALDAGKLTPSEIINDDGLYKLGPLEYKNAGDEIYGDLDLHDALQVSSDVYFYTLGGRLQENIDEDGDEFIQDWAKSLSFGDTTGIDVPGEALGRVPTPEWRNELFEDGDTDRPWTVGDNVNLSIGQGDLLAAPLQLAVAYATLGNGGTVVTPHVGLRSEDPDGKVVQEIAPPPAREVEIDDAWRDTILGGLTSAAMEPGGTSYPVFGSFPVDIAGKTGTAETFVDQVPYDQGWYAALMPADDPEVAVVYTIEKGGFGVDSAAPAAKQILEEYARKYLSVSQRQIDEAAATPTDSTGTVVAE
ncbi:MAG: penicillin-binding protein 2 [Solirubrobacterales bacterium]|jgi:penicillin-binding protein 2|nr:penicillin-binding protein 2 [Solirubrobacterales bacterium]